MSNLPVVILGSARPQSDTGKGVEQLFRGQPHKIIQLLDYPIEPYRYTHDYTPADKFLEVIAQILPHPVILFATPVYWYAMSGLLKTFFDRFTDLITIRKDLGRKLKGKKVFLLAVGADAELPPGFLAPFKLTAEYLNMDFIDFIYIPVKNLDTYFTDAPEPETFLQKLITPKS